MSKLLYSVIFLGLWAVQGSHGQLLSEPTQGSQIGDLDRPPEPTQMRDTPGLRHLERREETGSSSHELVVTLAQDKTCGFLSGRSGIPITCDNGPTCMWANGYPIMCGDINDIENIQGNVRCYDRAIVTNPHLCNDTCLENNVALRCIEESAPYCVTYVFPEGHRYYRCSSTSASRVSSVYFTYNGQEKAEFITTTLPLTGTRLSTTTSTTSTGSNSSTIPPSSSRSPDPPPSQNNLGAIIGGAIGGFAAVSLVILAIVWFVRQSRKKKHRPPTQVTPTEQAPLPDPNAGKPDTRSPVQSDWRSSTMTALSSPHSTSPQVWMDQPVSPDAQSDTSQGILPPRRQHLAYEMSGESVQPRTREMGDSRVYEMAGDSNHPWV